MNERNGNKNQKHNLHMDLLLKKLEGPLTKEEATAFQEWLLESEENAQLFKQCKLLKREGKAYQLYEKINIEVAWQNVRQKAQHPVHKKTSIIWMQSPWRIAASVAIIVGASFLINNWLNKNNDLIKEFGQPGSFQAYLQVENQREIKVIPEIRNLGNVPSSIQNNLQGELRYDLQEKNNLPIKNHTLKVPRGGEYKIVLEDGTKVWLNAETNLSYPSKFEAAQRLVHLEGEAYFEVVEDVNRPFIVKTNKMDIEVLGTSFNIAAYPNEDVYYTTLVEGKVNVKEHSGSQQILQPGDQHSLVVARLESEIKQVDTQLAIDWTEGKYIFKNENLEDVLKQISKWYALEYKFLNNDLRKIKYTGTAYKNKSLQDLLDAISFIRPIEFKIEHQKLLILKK